MTMDRSLRVRKTTVRNRSVLTRAERIQRLMALDRWTDDQSPLGLPKVRVQKITVKKKKKQKRAEAAQQQQPAKKGK
ncbi:MAG: small basic protein [Thermoguttaceae bacterium]|nr:small basic protein [Thermoguttaceae bacterium]MDW8077300.1 small basic protein [Thermoguttaceae bacterium]